MEKIPSSGDTVEITKVIRHHETELGRGDDFFEEGHRATLMHVDTDGDWWAEFHHSGEKLCIQKGYAEFKVMQGE